MTHNGFEIVFRVIALAIAVSAIGWFLFHCLKRTEDPARLVFKWILTALVAFAAWKAATLLGFRLTRGHAGPPRTPLLLVFRLGKRSEQLFDKLRRYWQSAGSISMIAGPDLVTTTVEPHEFLEFVSGRLGRQFVGGTPDLRLGKTNRFFPLIGKLARGRSAVNHASARSRLEEFRGCCGLFIGGSTQ